MNKKIFLIGILLVLAVSVVAVSAVNFNTPDGFEVKKDLGCENREVSFMGVDAKQNVTIMQKNDQQINVSTYELSKDANLTRDGMKQSIVEKTISGKQGFFEQKDGKSVFIFQDQDNKRVIVNIEAPSEDLIAAVLK